MTSINKLQQTILRLLLLAFALAVFSLYIKLVTWDEPRAGFEQIVNGTAYKPFVYRVLIPWLIRAAGLIAPVSRRFYAIIIMFLCFIGFIAVIYRLSLHYWASINIAYLNSFACVLMLIPLMISDNHVYDMSTLLLSSLALLTMTKRNWRWYLAIFVLGCLNKETFLLFAAVFAICFLGILERRTWFRLLFAQMGIYTVIRLFIMHVFRDNPGGMLEFHLQQNLLAVYKLPWLIAIYFAIFLMAGILVFVNWKEKPAFLRRSFLILAIPLGVLYLFFGRLIEIRVFYEAYPAFFLLAIPTLAEVFKLDYHAHLRTTEA